MSDDDAILTLPRLLAQGNPTPPQEADVHLRDVIAALDAAGYLVIPKDDVTEEYGQHIEYRDGHVTLVGASGVQRRQHNRSRLCTRWEQITTEASS